MAQQESTAGNPVSYPTNESFLQSDPKAALLRETKRPHFPNKEAVTFSGIDQIDHDSDLWFQLRGYGYNPLIDAALPLFGLVMRVRKTNENPGVDKLYDMVKSQILLINEEVERHHYDNATQLAYRYCLCSFIDEAVMGTSWGSQSIWAERSLLSYFHDETWGGEKFFTVLSRMLLDQEKYKDILEFMYLCLCMGFKGRYGVQMNGADELQQIINRLHKALRQMRGDAPEGLTDAHANVAPSHVKVGKQWPWWSPWFAALVVLVATYTIYAIVLGNTTSEVLSSLEHILRR